VPRLGLTREIGDFHFKALYSGAFKAPAIENIELGEDVRPERTRVWEVEAGWLATDNLMVAVNLYDIKIDGPTTYSADPETLEEVYLNVAPTGTRGLEAEARLRTGWMWATASWSFYTARGRNEAEEFAVEGQPDALLGFALYKGTLRAGFEPLPRVTISPSLAFFGPRWGCARADVSGEPVLERPPASCGGRS
jgi:outer membrane receptor protein involved in Fe transport